MKLFALALGLCFYINIIAQPFNKLDQYYSKYNIEKNIVNDSLDIDPLSFFPSAVGNYWEYNTENGHSYTLVAKDSIDENGYKYIYPSINDDPVYGIDTNLFVYFLPLDESLNWRIYKLDADTGDTWMVHPEEFSSPRQDAYLGHIYEANIFGENRIVKEVFYVDLIGPDTSIWNGWVIRTQWLVNGIGEYITFSENGEPIRVLTGCIIDGDTLGSITTSIENNPFIENEFELYQNYPNPFNPITTIKYSIPNFSSKIGLKNVNLSVYDALGRKAATLVNELQKAGEYEVSWDATTYASGIYICRLIAGKYIKTNKMILME
jgi:hypothetical protein